MPRSKSCTAQHPLQVTPAIHSAVYNAAVNSNNQKKRNKQTQTKQENALHYAKHRWCWASGHPARGRRGWHSALSLSPTLLSNFLHCFWALPLSLTFSSHWCFRPDSSHGSQSTELCTYTPHFKKNNSKKPHHPYNSASRLAKSHDERLDLWPV